MFRLMCGRYDLTETPLEVGHWFRVRNAATPNFPPRYNIAPTQDVPVVRLDKNGERELVMLRWGLIPWFSADPKVGYSTINARAETVDSKPAFRQAFQKRRCLVPATGYFEWKATEGGKQPYRFVPKDGGLFAFAGLWEFWKKGAEQIVSFSIIVTEGNEVAREIHDRMPAILDPEHHDAWLTAEPTNAKALLRPYPAASMRMYAVSKRVRRAQK